MDARLDHVMLVVRDLERAAATYEALGFRVIDGGRHTGMGTYNKIVRFGLDYLELLAVYSEEEASGFASRRAIMEFLKEREGAFTYALAVQGMSRDVPAFEERERKRPDGSVLRWRTGYQNLMGQSPVRPFLIECEAGGHPNGAVAWTGITVGVLDLAAYRELLGDAKVPGLTLVPGDGIRRLTLRTNGIARLIPADQACGIELELAPA